VNVLLVTDLDNTLVGDDVALATLNCRLAEQRSRIGLVYATGRSYASGCELKADKQLLEPDYWVTGVGSEIYTSDGLDSAWADLLSQDWQRQAILSLTQTFPELLLQEDAAQNPWKISFHLDPTAPRSVLEVLYSKLQAMGLLAQIVFSSDRDVDILPQLANKGNAVAYLQQQLQVHPDVTLVCGDSGNDISLFQQPARGVIVSNAQAELLQWFQTHGQPHHYLAQRACAGGILEALEYFDLLEV
jgi:sucrose-6F-phosphate phosphohydrolase